MTDRTPEPQTTNLVKRLRALSYQGDIFPEAADAIEELTAALRSFSGPTPIDPVSGFPATFKQFVRAKADALLSKYGASNG